MTDTVDPLAGSYFLEKLTDEIENSVDAYLQQIDKMGGAVAAIKKQFFQNEIASSAWKYQSAIEKQEKIIVGVNKYQMEEETHPEVLKVSDEQVKKQVRSLAALRQNRDNQGVAEALAQLKTAAQGSENVMPYIIAAVEKYATLGEISGTLRQVFGEYSE